MTDDLKWTTPPPSKKGKRETKYQPLIDQLKDKPGEWALVIEGKTAASARPFQKAGCEVTTRTIEGQPKNIVDIYARFPEPEKPAQAAPAKKAAAKKPTTARRKPVKKS